MATRSFDRLVLTFVGSAVIAAGAWMAMHPPVRGAQVPRVVFAITESENAAVPVRATGAPPLNGVVEVSATRPTQPTSLFDAKSLADTFERMGYHLDSIKVGEAPVPRVFLARLPDDMPALRQIELRKTVFFKTMLPLVLKENERILSDRRRIYKLRTEQRLGRDIDAVDRLWLSVMAERYGTDEGDYDELLTRVDIVPPSMALAQAAEESGWGTSRFAQDGNALFGQWTFSGRGIVPEEREDGKTHKVKRFDTLAHSVAAYMRNLNTHDAYAEFRGKRADGRRAGNPPTGAALVPTLTRYSERGREYIDTITTIIGANELAPLDDARLSDHNGDGSA